MNNEYVIEIDGVKYRFKLTSQKIVELEKQFGKNIFEIFASMSFTTMRELIRASLISPEGKTADEIMDALLTKFTLMELSDTVMTEIAIASGLIKRQDTENVISDISKN